MHFSWIFPKNHGMLHLKILSSYFESAEDKVPTSRNFTVYLEKLPVWKNYTMVHYPGWQTWLFRNILIIIVKKYGMIYLWLVIYSTLRISTSPSWRLTGKHPSCINDSWYVILKMIPWSQVHIHESWMNQGRYSAYQEKFEFFYKTVHHILSHCRLHMRCNREKFRRRCH